MDATVIDAYVRGRLAGANFFHAKTRDGQTARPDNPYASSYLATVEWERGFKDGFAQGQRAPRTRPAERERRHAA